VRKWLQVLRPFRTIAQELTKLRQLYEADLASRTPPVYLVTESPNVRNTEVSYQGVTEDRPLWKRLWSPGDPDEQEEE
jgi:hypothetical protein